MLEKKDGGILMNITTAEKTDVPGIMNLISECIREMEGRGIYQWGDFYPTVDIITNDIQCESLYTMQNRKECVGIICLNEEQSPEYREIEWLSDERCVLVVHRLAVHPKWHEQGIGRKFMDFAEKFATEKCYTSIRLDAYSGNPRAISFYEKCGYEKTGQVYFPKRTLPFFCYEKVLKD